LHENDTKSLRQSDNDEVKPVPSITQEREVSENESSCQNLRQTLGRVDRRENFPTQHARSLNSVDTPRRQTATQQRCMHGFLRGAYYINLYFTIISDNSNNKET